MNKSQILKLIISLGIISIISITIYFNWFLNLNFNFLLPNENIKCSDCNVILISLDDLRSDHISSYGYFRNTTPNIDRLVKESILFENAFSQASWTIPSHASLFTSKYPIKIHMLSEDDKLNESELTISKILKNNGYKTFGLINVFQLNSTYGFNQGFDVYEELNENNTNKTLPIIFDWLENNTNEKFFSFIHFYSIHLPYGQPPYDNLFDPTYKGFVDNISFESLIKDKSNIYLWNYTYFDKTKNLTLKLNDRDIQHIIAHYDGGILYTDSILSKIFDKLKELELYNNTIIIIFSDHGENLMEHNYLQHGDTLYDEAIHVPIIIYVPNSTLKGIRIKSQVQLIDVVPTILNLLDISIPRQAEGKSLIPLISGRQEKDFDKYVFSEDADYDISIRTPNWKLIKNADNSMELYDLKNDPKELNNRINEPLNIIDELKYTLIQWKIKENP